MKPLLVAALLISLPQAAVALHRASDQEVRDIAIQTNKVGSLSDQITAKEAALGLAKGKEAIALATTISDLKKQRGDTAERAIWMTLRAYGIIPFNGNDPVLPSGKSVLPSPERGTRITWVPVYEDAGIKSAQNSSGKPAGSRNILPNIAGNTASDGISRMFPSAFDSPVELASYMIHEQKHFEQNTTAGKGDAKTTAELEVEAYEQELALVNDPNNILGYSAAQKKLQERRLTRLLDGENGKLGFREQAKQERAEADANRSGRPLPERSLVSHSESQINQLIEQAKKQVLISQRDHDDRLKRTLGELSGRSCANPGSVSQEELNSLPQPIDQGFYYGKTPSGGVSCSAAYLYLAQGGRDAALLKAICTQGEHPQPEAPPIQAVQPTLPPPIARQNPPPPFSSAFRQMSDFARAACAAPEQVVIGPFITRLYDYSNAYADVELARQYTASLDGCPKLLFSQLYGTMRAQKGWGVDRQWVRTRVAEYTPGQGPSSSNPAPQNGQLPTNYDPCRDNGNRYCP